MGCGAEHCIKAMWWPTAWFLETVQRGRGTMVQDIVRDKGWGQSSREFTSCTKDFVFRLSVMEATEGILRVDVV